MSDWCTTRVSPSDSCATLQLQNSGDQLRRHPWDHIRTKFKAPGASRSIPGRPLRGSSYWSPALCPGQTRANVDRNTSGRLTRADMSAKVSRLVQQDYGAGPDAGGSLPAADQNGPPPCEPLGRLSPSEHLCSWKWESRCGRTLRCHCVCSRRVLRVECRESLRRQRPSQFWPYHFCIYQLSLRNTRIFENTNRAHTKRQLGHFRPHHCAGVDQNQYSLVWR
uniref:Uncharacterized protein n=1 Tax=Cacopsylla melanoneura TaxID=428564 RepID=A0A8D8XVR6_9HEMI